MEYFIGTLDFDGYFAIFKFFDHGSLDSPDPKITDRELYTLSQV